MTKLKPAGHRRRPHKVTGGKLVDCVESVLLPDAGSGHGEVELERVPGHGPGLGQPPGGHRQSVESPIMAANTPLGTSPSPAAGIERPRPSTRARASSSM